MALAAGTRLRPPCAARREKYGRCVNREEHRAEGRLVNREILRVFLWAITAVNACTAASNLSLGPGVTEALARERAETISSLRYELSFGIPEKRTEVIRGSETVRFALRAPHRVVLDFAQPRDRVTAILSGDKPVEADFVAGHLIIPASATEAGENAIQIAFLAGDDSLNRNDDFLYTLFVPARAHFAWPCFDQPDLKARYSLTLDVPSGWQAVANGVELERATSGVTTTVRFAETQPISTYLFAFAAGKFRVEIAERNGRTFRMFHRETDERKVARNRDAIFDLHARALAWLEEHTGIRYPWGKFDFVLIPSFQFEAWNTRGPSFITPPRCYWTNQPPRTSYWGAPTPFPMRPHTCRSAIS